MALREGKTEVFTDPLASPTSFPFKVASLEGTLSEQGMYEDRPRLCDLGYLRKAYRKEDGSLGYRCPGEPVAEYLRKGGSIDETVGRKCLCNGLTANIGLGQIRGDGYTEPAMLTAGDDLACVLAFMGEEGVAYRASDVIDAVLPASGT